MGQAIRPPMTMTQNTVNDLQGQLTAYMERKGLRSTSQRRLVSETFFRVSGHHSIDDVLAMVRAKDPKVGYATVYRTMKLLEDAGLAHARRFGDARETLYEVAVGRSHHDHLICEHCGKIVEFVSPEVERLQDHIAARHGFVLGRHRHELYGTCSECRTTP